MSQPQSKVVEALLEEDQPQSERHSDGYADHSDYSDQGHGDQHNDGNTHTDSYTDYGDW